MLRHMDNPATLRDGVLGRGVYGASDAVRLVNFGRNAETPGRPVSRRLVLRWLRGGVHADRGGLTRRSMPLWRPDYSVDDDVMEISFRDLIELRFVRACRDAGLTLPTIEECFARAVEEVHDHRPFSTQRFRTDGKTIFLAITHNVGKGELTDLKQRQRTFQRFIAPGQRDLEFDAGVVARWFPLGIARKSVVVDPTRAFGRPIVAAGSVPTEILFEAVKTEGSPEKVAKLYEVPRSAVRDAVTFQQKLAA